MKKKLTITVLLFIYFFSPSSVLAVSESIPDELQNRWLDSGEIEDQWRHELSDYREYLPFAADEHWLDPIKDGSVFSLKNWLDGISRFFIDEWMQNGRLIALLIFLTLLSVFLKVLVNSFENQSVSQISYFVIFGVLLTLAITSFHQAVTYTTEAIHGMGHFMLALLPLMLSMMAAFGNVASVAFFHPLILFFVQMSGVLITKVVLPLFFFSAILSIASEINKDYNVTQFAKLMKHIAFGILGAFLTLFLSVMSLQGVNAAVTDGVAIRATKFVTSNFIPVIGKMFTDATDTVLSASLLLKNTIGLAGVVMVMIITLFPALKVLVLGLIFKVTAAILQPVADGPIVEVIDIMGKHIFYILTALLTISLMFFFSLVMLIIVGNMTLMIR
ncbi:stage III sporulation protein AE [Halalkalibacillus sediminis]|uniref:Stage III sporulation protein AE n=1 Tax=Halalkalibacillus sediminis TaxID=2018042 RepID=A0A2I0QXA2_9BACI|nr:stage III sporulation protein AE [Halalkalibacillus sediminis]PKR78963.1 stage III sporulation protein AE [Halalkalibacillus sediminis]